MLNNRKYIIGGAVALVILVVAFLLYKKFGPPDTGCDSVQEISMRDGYLRPFLEKNQTVKVHSYYYNCHQVKHGDLVVYQLGSSDRPLIRIVRALEGDTFSLVKDPQKRGWNIVINGKLLMSNEDRYFFGKWNVPATLELYMKNNTRTLGPGEMLLFAAQSPGAIDSGQFGLFSTSGIIGKVILDEDKQSAFDDYIAKSFDENKESAAVNLNSQSLSATPSAEKAPLKKGDDSSPRSGKTNRR